MIPLWFLFVVFGEMTAVTVSLTTFQQLKMDSTVEHGLIVESSFRSRKQLINDLQGEGLVEHIYEAQSVNDGLQILGANPFEACFLGSSLSQQVAVDFLTRGREVSLSPDCAFLAVINKENDYANVLYDAGADGVLHTPYEKSTFTKIVTEAVFVAQTQRGKAITSNAIHAQPLAPALKNVAESLMLVCNQIGNGALSLEKTGLPSQVTRDALSKAIEKAILPFNNKSTLTDYDRHFISSLVDWFSNRVHTSEQRATELLRQRLLNFYRTPTQKKEFFPQSHTDLQNR